MKLRYLLIVIMLVACASISQSEVFKSYLAAKPTATSFDTTKDRIVILKNYSSVQQITASHTPFVPYNGATTDVYLGHHSLYALEQCGIGGVIMSSGNILTAGNITLTSGGITSAGEIHTATNITADGTISANGISLNSRAADSAVVHNTGEETISGTKHFEDIQTWGITSASTITAPSFIASSAGIRLASNGSIPCQISTRGTLNFVAGGTGVKDIVQVCAKDASNNYAWRTIY
jgi:hypothetical protein